MSESKQKTRTEINKDYYQRERDKLLKKGREYYQEHKEEINKVRTEKRKKRKEIRKQEEQARTDKYYGAEAIKILMRLKDYTELNARTRKIWANFCWTLKDTKEEIHDIVQIMKLTEEGEKLVQDYWRTAKSETEKWGRWNNLTYDQQQQLIKHWGLEKERQEQQLEENLIKLKERGKGYEKEIEVAKYHEERGKKGCSCWHCEQQGEIRKEIEKEWKEEVKKMDETEEKERLKEKIECNNCGRVVNNKHWDEEADMCKRCSKEFDE